MLEVRTSINIGASASLVWAILTDFGSYRHWNPFIRSIHGEPRHGSVLKVTFQHGGRLNSSAHSVLTHLREPRELRWSEQRPVLSLCSREHRFRIEPLPAGGVRFHQAEQIEGIFAWLVRLASRRRTEEGFHAMNEALKVRAERLGARMLATGTAKA